MLTVKSCGLVVLAVLCGSVVAGAASAGPPPPSRAKLALSGATSSVAQLDAQTWSLAKTGAVIGNQTVSWAITATPGANGSKRLQVTGKATLRNSGTLPATVGNVIVTLQHKPTTQWVTLASDVADATSGDAATTARVVRRTNAPADDSTLIDDDDLDNHDPYSVFLVTETARSGALSFTNSANQPLSVAQLTLAPGASLVVNFIATYNNDQLALPGGRKVRAELVVTFGNADGGHKTGFNVDINGNGSIGADEARVHSGSARLGDKLVPAAVPANTPVTLTDTAADITTTGTVTFGNAVFALGATTGIVTATVAGGTAGGTIQNCAHLTGTGINLAACSELAVAKQAHDWQVGEMITYSQSDWGGSTSIAGLLLVLRFNTVYASTGGVLEVGSGFSMQFLGAEATIDYLPGTGAAGPLTSNLGNPGASPSGGLGGEVTGLKLNIDFSDAGFVVGSANLALGDLTLCGLTSAQATLNGSSVRNYLEVASTALGGGAAPLSYGELAQLASELNVSFDSGLGVSQFARDHLSVGPCP